MRSRVLLGALFGMAGGFVGFLLQESMVPHNLGLAVPVPLQILQGVLVGAMLGMALGAVEGAAVGSNERMLSGAAVGAAIGALGGVLGIYFGSILYGAALFGRSPLEMQNSRSLLDFTHLVVARALGITLLGALPGLAVGAATRSPKRAMHGLIGGLLGGFIVGLMFDLVAQIIARPLLSPVAAMSGQRIIEIGGPSRAMTFTGIGLFTGLLIGLVDEALKQAWLRVLAGRNEGRDFIISRPLTILGRDERADVPLYGDPTLAPQHAAIRIEGSRHVLYDGGSPVGTIVNGQRAQSQEKVLLRDGDMIQLGGVRVLFREKATASRLARSAPDATPSAARGGAVSVPGHLCPFCGAQKDASGNCMCSVPGQVPAPVTASQSSAPTGVAVAPEPAYTGVPYPLGGGQAGLTVLEGPYAGQVFPLHADDVVIGREPGLGISLIADPTVSRRHARIAFEAGSHVIYDEGSSNGTYVNGVRISGQPLAPGDVVLLGATKVRYA